MSAHIHERGKFLKEIGYPLLWRCKHCGLERAYTYWRRYHLNLKQIMEAIAANGLPDHEAREEHAWSNSFDGVSPSPRLARQIIHDYHAWQKEER